MDRKEMLAVHLRSAVAALVATNAEFGAKSVITESSRDDGDVLVLDVETEDAVVYRVTIEEA